MINEAYVKQFISLVDKKRQNVTIHGNHPDLNTWVAWYKGHTNWHEQKVSNNNGGYKTITIKSSNFAKVVAEEWSNNYANEDTSITIQRKKNDNKAIQEIIKREKVMSNFGSFAEKFIALGIGATIVMPKNFEFDSETGNIQKGKNAEVEISFIPATRILPITIYDGECTECAFVKYGTKKCTMFIHLLIDNEYTIAEVSGDNNGSTDTWNFKWEEAKILNTGSNVPLFQIWYFNRADSSDVDNVLGSSVYANAIDTFKIIDTMYDSLFKEYKNSAKKRFISTSMMSYDSDGNLVDISLDDEEFAIPKDIDAQTLIQEFNGEIRIQAYTTGLNYAMNYAGKQCGLGQSKFEFGSGGGRPIQTATGIIAKESEMYRNIIKQENLATDKFTDMLMAIKEVNNTFTSNPKMTFEREDVKVVYDDNIIEDTASQRQRDLSEVQAGIMTPYEYRATWYDEDEETAKEKMQSNGLLIDKYITALQSNAITPELFVDIVYGDNAKDKESIVEYIKEKSQASTMDFGYNDEGNSNSNPIDNEDEDDE